MDDFKYMVDESSEALRSISDGLDTKSSSYRIVRYDLQEDSITKFRFANYDDAYDELERFYGDLCCSDERVEYSIVSI